MSTDNNNSTTNTDPFFKLEKTGTYTIQPKANPNNITQDWIKLSNKSLVLSNPHILYSSTEIIPAIQEASLTDQQFQKFSQSYNTLCNEYKQISFENLKTVILAANLTTDQAKILCLSLETEYRKNHSPDFSSQYETDLHEINHKNANIFYKFTSNGLEIDGGMYGINIDNLLPKVLQKDGKYTCGTTTSPNIGFAIDTEKAKLRQIVLQNFVYKDLLSRQTSGEKLSLIESNFITKHQELLKKHGLYQDKSGTLKQHSPNNTNVIMFNNYSR